MHPLICLFRRIAALVAVAFLGLPATLSSAEGAASPFAAADAVLDRYLERRLVAGGVLLVARDGVVVHHVARGHRALGGAEPMLATDPFRLASMTKPVTAAAAMLLVDRGKLQLDEPIGRLLPEFAAPRVWVEAGDPVAAARPITLRNLLSQSSGITSPAFGGTPVDALYRAPGALDWATLETLASSLAKLPLAVEPDSRWIYSLSMNVVARLVEVASGERFDRFLARELFEPLGMRDTGFAIRPELARGLPAVHRLDRSGQLAAVASGGERPTELPTFFSGNGGLYSTATDFLRFAEMLRSAGRAGGRQLLRPESVAEMTRNQLAPELLPWGLPGHPEPGEGYGFGLGVTLDRTLAKEPAGNGSFYWAGGHNTFFWVDPEARLVGILLLQYEPFRALPIDLEVREAVYEGLVTRAAE